MSPGARKNGPNAIGDLLDDPSNAFGKLLRRAESIGRLSRSVSRFLDADLAAHCKLANARDGTLVFVCTSAAWSNRLLMQAPQLLAKLDAAGISEIDRIEAKTRPA